MKKMTYLFLLAATLGACSPKPENKIETPPKSISLSLSPRRCHRGQQFQRNGIPPTADDRQ